MNHKLYDGKRVTELECDKYHGLVKLNNLVYHFQLIGQILEDLVFNHCKPAL